MNPTPFLTKSVTTESITRNRHRRNMPTVAELGERTLIERMLKHITPMPDMPIPFWDDVMAVNLTDNQAAVFNTDMLVWSTDIPPGMTYKQAGRKAVVMNFSDLAAKGVQPQAFLNNLALPRTLDVVHAEELAKGFEQGAREYDAYVIGGDTNEAFDIIISGVAFGVGPQSILMKRNGAQPGDTLCTTGSFGDTAAAFKILLEDYTPPAGIQNKLLESVYQPKARVKEGRAIAETGQVTSSMDSSDGLAISLHDLQRSSQVGFNLTTTAPSQEAKAFAQHHSLDPNTLALYGGEEYHLVFTVKPEGLDQVRQALQNVDCQLIILGEATKEKTIQLTTKKGNKTISKTGWNHFTQ
jgi:thiamine-monophosphate kinase